MDDIELISQWKVDRDPKKFHALMERFNPVINKFTNQFSGTGVSKNALRTSARANTIRAINTYDPNAGTKPITHVYNNLKKLNRVASESLTSGHIPESRSLKMATFKSTITNLEDRLGREASIDEMAKEMKWSREETARMNSELEGETTASTAEFDFYGNSTSEKSKDMTTIDYMYTDLSGKDKVIFEHTFGLGGKPILNNKQIAEKLNTNEMNITRSKRRLSKIVKENR